MSTAMLVPMNPHHKDTAIVTTAAASAGFSRQSFDFRRKKARNACFALAKQSTVTTTEINSPKIPPSLLPFTRTSSFDHNVHSLCGQFPQVHQGVITSLLESAANDLSKASCLIKQVSESGGMSNSTNSSRSAKRTRDWIDVPMDGTKIDDDDHHTSDSASNDVNIIHNDQDSHATHTSTSNDVQSVIPHHDNNDDVSFQIGNRFHPSISSTSTNSNAINPQTTSPSSTITSPLPRPAIESVPVTSTTCRNSPNTLQGLNHTIHVLSRVVLKQSDKINQLQSEHNRLLEENRELKSSLTTSTEELRQCREANQILQFYLSSNRGATDTFFNGGNGSGSSGFDGFAFNNRIPDVF